MLHRSNRGVAITVVGTIIFLLNGLQHEAMLFAAVGLVVGGLDDLAIDLIFFARWLWRRLFVYTRHAPMTTATLPSATDRRLLAVFVPAWDESAVIGHMLGDMIRKWHGNRHRIFVGAYPNDPGTIAAVEKIAKRSDAIRLAVGRQDGPTTKADCLNLLWNAMLAEEATAGVDFKAVVLHDAEDVVHPDALRLLDVMIDRFDLVQLPVKPLLGQSSQWIAGHYCDEFAEAHGKYLSVREALGAAVPSAGVGCAFSREALMAIAAGQQGRPFDPASLTEDYEIGLRIAEMGRRGVFVRMTDARGRIVCTQEHFPETLALAVRQKARWMIGIALSGWDRMGWRGGLAERWMRLRDRRAGIAAVILFAAYVALLLQGVLSALALAGIAEPAPLPSLLSMLLLITAALMLWRLAIRALFVARAYGWRQGLLSVPRTFVGNFIAISAARRAIFLYLATLRGAPLAWDKTPHVFPHDEDDCRG
jgi:adsorption protein B